LGRTPFKTLWAHAVCDSLLDDRERLVAFALLAHMDGDGLCRPTQARLARYANRRSTTTVKLALRELRRQGFLIIEPGFEGFASRYQATIPTIVPRHPGMPTPQAPWDAHEGFREEEKTLESDDFGGW
jgi:hypothetical protein